jgi:hypothetical protein
MGEDKNKLEVQNDIRESVIANISQGFLNKMVAHATPISKECDYICSTFKYIQVHHIVEMIQCYGKRWEETTNTCNKLKPYVDY